MREVCDGQRQEKKSTQNVIHIEETHFNKKQRPAFSHKGSDAPDRTARQLDLSVFTGGYMWLLGRSLIIKEALKFIWFKWTASNRKQLTKVVNNSTRNHIKTRKPKRKPHICQLQWMGINCKYRTLKVKVQPSKWPCSVCQVFNEQLKKPRFKTNRKLHASRSSFIEIELNGDDAWFVGGNILFRHRIIYIEAVAGKHFPAPYFIVLHCTSLLHVHQQLF